MELNTQILLYIFLITVVVGGVTNKTNFCTMGAVSDWINIGDTGRLRSWFLAIATAIIGVAILNGGWLDISLANSGETGKPPYAAPVFVWPRYLIGGVLFGIGMTLASGCGNKTLVRIGGGNMKSVVVFLIMGAAAYLMIYTNFGYRLFLQWMQPVAIDFSVYGMESQSIASLVAYFADLDVPPHLWSALILGGALLIWVFSGKEFRSGYANIIGGVVVGIAIVLGWYLTAGVLGQTLLEEAEFLDVRPYDIGAQSLTFVKPGAHFYFWIRNGFASDFITFALIASVGIMVGSAIYAFMSGSFRTEWFYSLADFVRHAIGAFLMGVGGVLSLGCTFGQALSGASTLAIGSFLTLIAIIAGCAGTMKVQYAWMMRE